MNLEKILRILRNLRRILYADKSAKAKLMLADFNNIEVDSEDLRRNELDDIENEANSPEYLRNDRI